MSGFSATHWPALGTTATVVVADPGVLEIARGAATDEIEAIDRVTSLLRHDSELTRVNERTGCWTAIGPLLTEAIASALRAATLTDGAVDPTAGAALVAAGHGHHGTVAMRRVPGWRTIALDRPEGRVLVPPGLQLDLGPTVQALAADRAARAAAEASGTGVLVSIGDDIATAGPAPRDGWLVNLAERDETWAADQAVVLRTGALATASTTASRWRTVSVVAATCTDARIAASAAIARGADAPAWLAERALAARLVDHEGVIEVLAGWPA